MTYRMRVHSNLRKERPRVSVSLRRVVVGSAMRCHAAQSCRPGLDGVDMRETLAMKPETRL